MSRHRTLVLGMLILILISATAAPLNPPSLSAMIDDFLEKLYERIKPQQQLPPPPPINIYDQMQGDQPQPSNDTAISEDYVKTMRNRKRGQDHDGRSKDTWIQLLKDNILRQIGRDGGNLTTTSSNSATIPPINLNISAHVIPTFLNATPLDDDHITEKIRSYYPSCEPPSSVDRDLWSDPNTMNLYFNFDPILDDKTINIIATATLRLYRITTANTASTSKNDDCDTSSTSSGEDDKLLRVSIYWYAKNLKKKRIKKKLCDSKVISENASWVELSVKPATRQWAKGRNLGLAVVVEDQEGTVLKADRYFKGATCTVGASTPKPIPTVIIDAARQSNQLDGINSLLGRNSTTALSIDTPLLPSIDICTLEFPENYTVQPHLNNLRVNACNLRRSHEQAQQLAERERFERLLTLPELFKSTTTTTTSTNSHTSSSSSSSNNNSNNRHIRHQRGHHLIKTNEFDPRSKMQNKRILTSEEVQALNLNITRVER